jgi:phospholipid/cholesterol/gamma-HCH transport system substrate-binding protein
MTSVKTKFIVGIFVLIGLVIISTAMIYLGVSDRFQTGHYYVAYFDESVQGLDKDSPVKYRGVAVGRVDNIAVAPDSKLIQVVFKLDSDLKMEKEITAQIKSVGITGLMYVELDRRPADEPDTSPRITFPSKYPKIATRPSEITVFIDSINDVLDQIKAMDFEGLSDKSKMAIDEIRKAVSELEMKQISSDMRLTLSRIEKTLEPEKWHATLAAFQTAAKSIDNFTDEATLASQNLTQTLININSIIDANKASISETIASLNQTVQKVDLFFEDANGLVSTADFQLGELQRQLTITMQNLEAASYSLNVLIETVAAQPSLLIFGDAPSDRSQ